MRRTCVALNGIGKISAWCLVVLSFLFSQSVSVDSDGLLGIRLGVAVAASEPGSIADRNDDGEDDSDQGDEGDDTGDEDDGDDSEPGDDEGDQGDDAGEDDGADDDGDGGGGEDALDTLVDDGDSDDDSEPDELFSFCEVAMSGQKIHSLDGLCSTTGGSKLRRRFGYIDAMAPLVADTEIETVHDPLYKTEQLEQSAAVNGSSVEQYVQLPEYTEGDVYVYSDGSWEQVIAANHERVEWRNHYGNHSLGVPDFTYKRYKWQTSTRTGERRFTHTSYLFDEPTTTLWPLTLKSKTRYDEKGKWTGQDGIERVYDSFWRCDVKGEERVAVAAGQFDTWRICCSRYRDSYSFPKSRAREYKTWYYAPSVEHWVLLTRENQGLKPDTRKELVAIIPDLQKVTRTPQAVVQIQQQFQDVLETADPNQRDLWIAATGDTVITMIPGQLFVDEIGTLCRQYNQDVQAADMTRRYPGISCRAPDGTWYVPRK